MAAAAAAAAAAAGTSGRPGSGGGGGGNNGGTDLNSQAAAVANVSVHPDLRDFSHKNSHFLEVAGRAAFYHLSMTIVVHKIV